MEKPISSYMEHLSEDKPKTHAVIFWTVFTIIALVTVGAVWFTTHPKVPVKLPAEYYIPAYSEPTPIVELDGVKYDANGNRL